jgi:hypothetical protein
MIKLVWHDAGQPDAGCWADLATPPGLSATVVGDTIQADERGESLDKFGQCCTRDDVEFDAAALHDGGHEGRG